VVAHSNDAIVGCTLEGKIVSWNVGAERIYGYAAEEVIGRPLDILIPPDRLDEFPQALTTVQRGDSLAKLRDLPAAQGWPAGSASPSPSRRSAASAVVSPACRPLRATLRAQTARGRTAPVAEDGRGGAGWLAASRRRFHTHILTAILGYSDLAHRPDRLSGQWMYKHLMEIRKARTSPASLTHQPPRLVSRRQPLFLRVFSINDSVKNLQKMLQRVIGEHSPDSDAAQG